MNPKVTLVATLIGAICIAPIAGAAQTPGAPPAPAKPAQKANSGALALQDFKKRIETYMAVHNRVAKAAGPMKTTNDPAEISRAKEALAAGLREARAEAQPGDIFTPEIRAAFRRILVPELQGEDGKDAKEIIKDDAPAAVPLKVNTKYPDGATRPTVPAAILANLPQLPKELEYRFVEKHLVLVDVQAGLIADFIPNAIK
jgi:hypothetical protein